MAKNSKDILKKTQELLSAKSVEKEQERTRFERERRDLIASLSQEIAGLIGPAINSLAQSQQVTFNKMRQMLREIKVEAPRIPEIRIPDINVPQPKVQVNVPDIKVPAVNVPKTDINFPDRMSVSMDAVDNERPLPVMMMDTKGKPMSFSMGSGGGGKADFLTIKDIRDSSNSSIISADGALKVEGNFGAALSVDYGEGEIGSATQRIVQATDAVSSVYVTGALGTIGTVTIDPDGNPIYSTSTAGLTDAELRASSVPVSQASDVVYSTNMATALASEIDSISTVQVSGAIDSVYVTGAGGTLAVNVVDSTGVGYSGSNPVPVSDSGLQTDALTDTELRASSVPVEQVSGSQWSTLSRPVQVRTALTTAYATLSTGTETTLATAVAGKYLDLVYIMGANDSDAAVTVFLRPVTAGNIVMALQIPASGTAGISTSVPFPVSDTGNAWTADMDDITGTNVYLSALFSQE